MKKVDEIKKFLLDNPDRLDGKYADTAKIFGTNYEQIRSIARRIRGTHSNNKNAKKERLHMEEGPDGKFIISEDSTRIRSLDDLLGAFSVDDSEWEVDWYDIGTYEQTGFDNNRKPVTTTMYRCKAKLKRVDPFKNLEITRQSLIEDLKDMATYKPKVKTKLQGQDTTAHCLEIGAYDLHLGKIGIIGDDYSMDIAQERLIAAIEHLLKRASGFTIDQILFVVGNDFLNTDGDKPIPRTTKGTPQFNSDHHIEMYKRGRKLITMVIDELSSICPVHVVVMPGNHDEECIMYLGDALELFYEHNENVVIDNTRPLMKGFKYGNNLIAFDHGHKMKADKAVQILPQRFRDIWSDVRYVELHRGHLHGVHHKKIGATSELSGITVRNLGSMAATDQWHDDKGFIGNVKRAHGFIWSKHNGLQAELFYNVPI
tara:strand:- start:2017 stop:3300 length:1284 start_codon:yes stop_codon:yes gene_type:complete